MSKYIIELNQEEVNHLYLCCLHAGYAFATYMGFGFKDIKTTPASKQKKYIEIDFGDRVVHFYPTGIPTAPTEGLTIIDFAEFEKRILEPVL